MNPQIQAAAAKLGYELRFNGVQLDKIRQLILQPTPAYGAQHDKLGLDDYLQDPRMGPDLLAARIGEALALNSAFPKHPNPREYVNKRLRKNRMGRQDTQSLTTAILCDLDARGRRLTCSDNGAMYYFNQENHQMVRAEFNLNNAEWHKTPFAIKLYRDYNLSVADRNILMWLGSQFSGELPVSEVKPERILTTRKGAIYYQVSGGKMIRVTAKEIRLLDNGSDDILFESEAVEDLEPMAVIDRIDEYQKLWAGKPIPNFWYPVMQQTRIKDSVNDYQRKILSLLYAISPWMYRWNGTQLPVEQMIGEAGSGKSTLYELRLHILNGKPILKNAPKDLRDWTASVASTGGLHVVDNMHMLQSQLRQELSDELCRVVTASNPLIEARKLYSDTELVYTPVRCTFAVTGIMQPFINTDIIQRSIITSLNKGEDEVEFDMSWQSTQIARFGGRAGWIAQQMVTLQRLMQLVEKKWDPNYKSKYRLINVEQLLQLVAEVFGEDGSWIPHYLDQKTKTVQADTDTTLKGLKDFAQHWLESYPHPKTRAFKLRNISEWAQGEEEYTDRAVLTNPRLLAQYIKQRQNLVATATGIREHGTAANATTYIAHLVENTDTE